MKTFVVRAAILLFFPLFLHAQEKGNPSLKVPRNYFIGNVALLDANINYERNIIYRPKYAANIRLGYGGFFDNQGGSKEYIATLVQLIGQKNSHFEFNLGVKNISANNNEDLNSPSPAKVWPDIFVGYRYEKPDGIFVFRTGLSFPSIFGIGIGFKF